MKSLKKFDLGAKMACEKVVWADDLVAREMSQSQSQSQNGSVKQNEVKRLEKKKL